MTSKTKLAATMAAYGLMPWMWRVLEDRERYIIIAHRISGEVRALEK